MKPSRRQITLVLVGIIAVYICSYVANSCFGGYWPQPVPSKMSYQGSGLGAPTTFLWQPYFGYNDGKSSDLAGTVYSPLINIDHLVWHKSLDLFAPEDEHLIFSTNNPSGNIRWHPRAQTMP